MRSVLGVGAGGGNGWVDEGDSQGVVGLAISSEDRGRDSRGGEENKKEGKKRTLDS